MAESSWIQTKHASGSLFFLWVW